MQLIRNGPLHRLAVRLHPELWLSGAIVAVLAMSWPRRLACAAGIAACAFVVSLAFRSSPGHGLPTSFIDRAPLFADAWAAGDEQKMLEFVRPADAEKYRQWLATATVPAAVATLRAADRKIKMETFERDDQDGATVTVRISAVPGAKGADARAEDFIQRQLWTYAAGSWYFVPKTPAGADQLTAAAPTTVISPATIAAARARNGAPVILPTPDPTESRDDDQSTSPRQSSGSVFVAPSIPPWKRQ